MLIIDDMKQCCGCAACFNACPQKAINMKIDEEGFLYPDIDNDLCIQCKKCINVCPVNNPKYINCDNPKCYAVRADDTTRYVSSSGGAFSIFAEYILKNDGVVCGAAYTSDWSVEHIIINNYTDLAKLRGSKYVQSEIKDCYSKIKQYLDSSKLVLFSGTPCQNAGLKSFLNKNYNNLYCLDLICHGTPSAKVLQKSLKEYTNGDAVNSLNLRDKYNGWGNGYWVDVNGKHIKGTDLSFIKAFATDLCLRKSCGNCVFNKIPRQGDITIGDYWGIDKSKDDKKGTSIIIINNEQGNDLFQKVEDDFILCEHIQLNDATEHNYNIIRSTRHNSYRDKFFQNFAKMSVEDNYMFCKNKKIDAAILNFWSYSNYGAMITGFALQKALQTIGFTNKLILYMNQATPRHKMEFFKSSHFKKFADKYLDYTQEYKYSELPQLNNITDTFIVGSDQVWRPIFLGKHKDAFYLSFADNNAKKIACSASMGLEFYQGTESDKSEAAFYIEKFDAISVREKSGQKILKDWGIDSVVNTDPVFWIDREYYDKIADSIDIKCPQDFIVSYFLGPKEPDNYLIQEYEKRMGIPVIKIDMNKTSMEEWLYYTKNAKLVLTNSFHGVCMSLIFNKEFICSAEKTQVYSRFDTLFHKFSIKHRFMASSEIIRNSCYEFAAIDYDKINSEIVYERQNALKWLKEAMNSEHKPMSEYENQLRLKTLYVNSLADELNKQKNLFNNHISSQEYILKEIINYSKYKDKYRKYKLKKIFSFGKRRKKYKMKMKELKQKIKKIQSLLKL